MGDYLKLFQTHSEYEAYITGSDKILPNVSYCEDNNEVHYNPWTDPRVIAKFNVEDESEPVGLYGADYSAIASDLFSKIEIDGEEISISELESDEGYYTFKTPGEHTVKYTLSDPEVIGDYAFEECIFLTSITIPSSVISIGNSAFYDCSSLTSIRVESGNTVYDSRNNCNAIIETATNKLICGCQNTIIPSSVISIGDGAFSSRDRLTSITIPSSVTSIGDSAFSYCSGLTSIEIPSGVTSIGNITFYYCTSLTSITIPSSVTSIGYSAFDGCSGLTSITISSGVTSIGNAAFNRCSSLTSIRIESGNTVYDSRNNCNAIIETATNTLLYGCQNTIIPSSVTSIGEYAFEYCISLTSINIPSSVTSIGDRAFSYCSGLTSIEIPSGVTRIGSSAFDGCSSLNSITSQATTAPTIQSSTFLNVKTGGTLYIPSGSNYSTWMGTGNYYLGKYGWTKVEQ